MGEAFLVSAVYAHSCGFFVLKLHLFLPPLPVLCFLFLIVDVRSPSGILPPSLPSFFASIYATVAFGLPSFRPSFRHSFFLFSICFCLHFFLPSSLPQTQSLCRMSVQELEDLLQSDTENGQSLKDALTGIVLDIEFRKLCRTLLPLLPEKNLLDFGNGICSGDPNAATAVAAMQVNCAACM